MKVACCVFFSQPGGSIFFTTINKTAQSYALAVVGAERLARLVEPGTHDWNKFISPEELESLLQQSECRPPSTASTLPANRPCPQSVFNQQGQEIALS